MPKHIADEPQRLPPDSAAHWMHAAPPAGPVGGDYAAALEKSKRFVFWAMPAAAAWSVRPR
jgi:hypothetical protein